MLSRVTACWLVLLVFAPFTAPFPTCDVATLFGRAQSRHAPIAPPTSAAVSHDAAVVASPAALRVIRSRASSVFRISTIVNDVSPLSANVKRTPGADRDLRQNGALKPVLRV